MRSSCLFLRSRNSVSSPEELALQRCAEWTCFPFLEGPSARLSDCTVWVLGRGLRDTPQPHLRLGPSSSCRRRPIAAAFPGFGRLLLRGQSPRNWQTTRTWRAGEVGRARGVLAGPGRLCRSLAAKAQLSRGTATEPVPPAGRVTLGFPGKT